MYVVELDAEVDSPANHDFKEGGQMSVLPFAWKFLQRLMLYNRRPTPACQNCWKDRKTRSKTCWKSCGRRTQGCQGAQPEALCKAEITQGCIIYIDSELPTK